MEGTQLDENFDYSEISERLEGYTGSDIANVCRSVFLKLVLFILYSWSYKIYLIYTRDAAMMCMRKKIHGQTPSQIKQIKKADIDLPVTTADFIDAINRCKKSVSSADLHRYQTWIEEFGSY